MLKKRFISVLASLLCLAFSVLSAPSITIDITADAGSGKDYAQLSGVKASGDTGALFLSVLKSDLGKTGFFEIKDSGNAQLRVEGTASGAAGQLATHLRIIWGGGSFVWSEVSSTVRDARWQAHRLSDEIVRRTKNTTGIASTRIALIGKETGPGGGADVYYCDYDGNGLVRLTNDRVPALSPYFHPNGNYIFYTSFLRKQPNVYRVPVGGGSRTPYASFTGLNTGGAVSPDGRYLALILSKPGNPELFVINMDSRVATRLTRTPRAAEASPCWSPDGRQIAYVSDESGRPSIHVIHSDTGRRARIAYSGSENVAPSWGSANRIAYCTKRGGAYQIAVCNPDGSAEEIVTSGPDHEDPSWAPDGRHIICSRKEGFRRYSICIVDTVTKEEFALPLPPGDWHAPDWSRPVSR